MSKKVREIIESLNDYIEGYDNKGLLELSQQERQEFIAILLNRLVDSMDYWTLEVVSLLMLKEAVPLLKKYLSEGSGERRAKLAKTLWEVDSYPDSLKILLDILKNDCDAYERRDAAEALSLFPIDQVTETLLMSLQDEDEKVRDAAYSSLNKLYKFDRLFQDAANRSLGDNTSIELKSNFIKLIFLAIQFRTT